MAKRFDTRRIKKHTCYRVHELAHVVTVSPATVRRWLGDGLQPIDDARPTLIMGGVAHEYLNARKVKAKRPMALGEFYCLRCKAPKGPLGGMADYVPLGVAGGRLVALCGCCEAQINRNISSKNLPAFSEILHVEIRGGN